MRIISLIVAVMLFHMPLVLNAQKKNLTIREYYKDKSLKLVLLDLSLGYNLTFDYQPDDIDNVVVDEINIKGLDLETTMKALLKDTGLDFSLEGDRIVRIFPANKIPVKTVYATRSNITVSGRIYEKSSGETLPYATVSLPGTTNGVISNIDGHFTLMNVPSDTSTITIQYLGYETQTVKLNPEIAGEEIRIFLKPVDYRIEEVMVVGEEKKLLTYAEKTSQISLRPVQIDMIPNLGEKDIFRTLQLMPGVSSGNETSSGL